MKSNWGDCNEKSTKLLEFWNRETGLPSWGQAREGGLLTSVWWTGLVPWDMAGHSSQWTHHLQGGTSMSGMSSAGWQEKLGTLTPDGVDWFLGTWNFQQQLALTLVLVVFFFNCMSQKAALKAN